MKSHRDIRSKTPETVDQPKKLLSLEQIRAGVADDLALLSKPENKHPDPTTPHDIGSLGYRSLISSLNLDGKLLPSTDAMHPSTFRNNALKNLEKVRKGQNKNIEDMGGILGRKDTFVGGDFGEGSFAFKLDDGNVQFVKDLKQLTAYLDKEKGFKISEGELRWQLQSGKTVESGGKRIEIGLLAADEAEQQLRNEVDHLEQRKDALASAYWPNLFEGERVYAYRRFKLDGTRPDEGFAYDRTSPEMPLRDKEEDVQLEPAKLYEAVNNLEGVCKRSIKQLHKDLRGIEIASDEVYAHKFRDKLYITGSSELRAVDLEKLKTQGLYIPQKDIDDLKNAGDLEDNDKPERVGSEIALRELRELQEQKKNIKDMAKRLDPKIFMGKDVDKWEGLIACRIVDPAVQNDAVTDNNVRLAENPRGIADDLKIPEEDRDKFCADLVDNGHAEYNGKRIELVEWGQAEGELKNEVDILKEQCQDLMVKDRGEAYKDSYHYTKDGGSGWVCSKETFIGIYKIKEEEIAKMDAGELIEPFKDGVKVKIEAFRLRESKKNLEQEHENRKKGIKEHLGYLTGINIPADSEVYAWKIDNEVYITRRAEPQARDEDLRKQGLELSKENKVEPIGLESALDKLQKQKQSIENLVNEIGYEDIMTIKDIPLNKQEEELQRDIKERKQSIENLVKELGRDNLTDIEKLPLNKQEKKLEEEKEERKQSIENLVKELGREDLTDIEDLPLNKQEKKLEEEKESQTKYVLELAAKALEKKYGKDQASIYKVNDGDLNRFDIPYWAGWKTPEQFTDQLEKKYKEHNIEITDKNMEDLKNGEKTKIFDNKGKQILEVEPLDFKRRVQYLEGRLKDKYIGEMKEVENKLSGKNIAPEDVPYQVTVGGKQEVQYHETKPNEDAVEMNLKQVERYLEDLQRKQKERFDYIKGIEPDGQIRKIYCEVIIAGKSEILDYQNLEAMKKGLKDQKLVPEEDRLDELKKPGSEYSVGDTTVKYLTLDEVVENLSLQRIKDMEAYKIREKLKGGKVYKDQTSDATHFGGTPQYCSIKKNGPT
jgi:hypothetical protein